MRIRRNASKLLGSTTLYAIPPPPTPAAAAAAAASASASASADDEVSGNVCELNCSPWDLMLLNLDEYLLTNRNEEEGQEGNSGNPIVSEQQEEQEPISTPVITSCGSAELTAIKPADQISERDPAQRERRKKAHKGKEKDTTTAETSADNHGSVSYCKKSDGKRWRCKRAAQLPHSFCSYHIAQVKSYSCSASNHPASSSASKLEAIDDGMRLGSDNYNPDSSGLYYYYEGFGPRRGKRRGGVAGHGGGDNSTRNGDAEMVREEEMDGDDENSCEIKMDRGGGGGGCRAAAGGDEDDDLDRFDDEEGEGDDRNNDSCGVERDGAVKKGLLGKLGKRRPAAVVKKRGRKPFKCRSLKSLL